MMQVLLERTDGFFGWLWRASWQASAVVLLVLVAQWLLRDHLSARWRHALWLLVIVRLSLPWSVPSPTSLFNWFQPGWGRPDVLILRDAESPAGAEEAGPRPVAEGRRFVPPRAAGAVRWLWLAGAAALPGCLLLRGWRFARRVGCRRPVTDGALLNLLEDCKQEMGVHTPVALVEMPGLASPCLLGFIRPRLLLPAGLAREFSLAELRYVFLHELGHIKRGDIPLNWLMTAALVVHWFNPLVWYACGRMRIDRELACDALALSRTHEGERRSYGQAILKLLDRFSRPALAPGLVGILENQNQMKRRISMIAHFKHSNGWPVLAVSACAGIALLTLTDPQPVPGAGESGPANPEGPPRIVSTQPKVGQTEVDPELKEISITFDRDMSGGFSWTGGPPDFPPSPEGQKARWIDKRTCVLPVKLEAARYYRVGINSTSFHNFKSADGVPARPSAIYFTTTGASEALKRKVGKPMIVGLVPKNGAQDVDPNLKEIRVTFNVPMGGGFSWTGGGEQFPTIPEGQKPRWEDDHTTCVLPVELKPAWEYHLGLNSPSHKNFQSAAGVPLDPVTYTFKTR